MACKGCQDRCWRLLVWLGFELEPEKGMLVLQTSRGRVILDMDSKPHTTRVALLALMAKVIA
jgi:hypothetical protein